MKEGPGPRESLLAESDGELDRKAPRKCKTDDFWAAVDFKVPPRDRRHSPYDRRGETSMDGNWSRKKIIRLGSSRSTSMSGVNSKQVDSLDSRRIVRIPSVSFFTSKKDAKTEWLSSCRSHQKSSCQDMCCKTWQTRTFKLRPRRSAHVFFVRSD